MWSMTVATGNYLIMDIIYRLDKEEVFVYNYYQKVDNKVIKRDIIDIGDYLVVPLQPKNTY